MPIITGNGGDLIVRHTGEVVGFNPSEACADGEHEGYGTVLHVDLTEWCRFYGKRPDEMPAHFDVLDVRMHFAGGYVEDAEPEWRDMCLDRTELAAEREARGDIVDIGQFDLFDPGMHYDTFKPKED